MPAMRIVVIEYVIELDSTKFSIIMLSPMPLTSSLVYLRSEIIHIVKGLKKTSFKICPIAVR